jgi:hypothetical protein
LKGTQAIEPKDKRKPKYKTDLLADEGAG